MATVLRRSSGKIAAPALLAVSLVALMSRGKPWAGEWAWTIDWANGTTILSGPLTAAIVAFDVQRWTGNGWRPLARQTPRSAALAVQLLAAGWAWSILAWATTVIAGLVLSADAGAQGFPHLAPLTLGPLVILAYAAVGASVGSALPKLLAAPVAGVGGFALTYLASAGILPPVFRVGGATGSLVGIEMNPRVTTATAVVLLSLVGLLVLHIASSTTVSRTRASAVALGLCLIAIVTSTYNLETQGDDLLAASEGRIVLKCLGTAPEVCMARQTSVGLSSLAVAMHHQAEPLIAAGIALPDKYVQDLPGRRPTAEQGLLIIGPDVLNRRDTDATRVADYLAVPAACAGFFGDRPPEDALNARYVVGQWIRENGPGPKASLPKEDPVGLWLRSDKSSQREWVRKTFGELRTCDLDRVDLPF